MKTEKPVQTLTTPELERFLLYIRDNHHSSMQKWSATRNHLIVLLLADAGLRVGELVQLEQWDLWSNNMAVTTLVMRAAITKTKTERILPLSDRIRAAIGRVKEILWIEPGEFTVAYAFPGTGEDGHISERQVQRMCKSAGKFSINREVYPHLLRHTFASRTMRVANIRVVQQLLGHKSLNSTQIYTHPNGDDLSRAIKNLEP